MVMQSEPDGVDVAAKDKPSSATGWLSRGRALVAAARRLIVAPPSPPEPVLLEVLPAAEAPTRPAESPPLPAKVNEDTGVWRAMLDALSDPSLVIDGNGMLLHANPAATEQFPKARSGLRIEQVARNPELIEAIDQVLADGGTRLVHVVERIPLERRLQASATRLNAAEAGPGVPAVIVVLRDLSEQDRLAQLRADFIANASHELRTPLASLRGFIETLQGVAKNDASARARFLDIMAKQAQRMTRLIDDLLSLSRVEMRAHVPPRGAVDMNEIAAFVAETLEPVARTTGAKLAVLSLPGRALVRGERDELVQAVQNLMQNALKYGRPGGRVEVRLSREGAGPATPGRVRIAVVDDGPGIAPEHVPRLTERFYRVDVATSREKGGTGLGLAIVKHIVTRHRGELKITSKPGEGATFSVLLDALVE